MRVSPIKFDKDSEIGGFEASGRVQKQQRQVLRCVCKLQSIWMSNINL